MSAENKTIESLITGGLLGAAIGAILSRNKEEGAIAGAIVGAAVASTMRANEEARKTNIKIQQVENGNLYEIEPGGSKRLVKKLEKNSVNLPDHYKLK